jgi:hypothetical protein
VPEKPAVEFFSQEKPQAARERAENRREKLVKSEVRKALITNG